MTAEMQSKRLSNVVPLRRPQPEPRPRERRRPRRSFGVVRELPSGRFQAYYTYLGERHLAPTTFFTRADASAWLAMREAEFVEHRWKPAPPPDQEKVRFGDYAEISAWPDETCPPRRPATTAEPSGDGSPSSPTSPWTSSRPC